MKMVWLLIVVSTLGVIVAPQTAGAIPTECEELIGGDLSYGLDCLVAVITEWISGGAWDGGWVVGGHGYSWA